MSVCSCENAKAVAIASVDVDGDSDTLLGTEACDSSGAGAVVEANGGSGTSC